MDVTVTVDKRLLPEGEAARSDFLRSYFCELMANPEKTPNGWQVTLSQPADPDYYVDPYFLDGLKWWSDKFGPVAIQDVPFTVNTDLGFQLSFQDSWTLYSWSKYLAECAISNGLPNEVVILHLDDHDDFMTPRLLKGREPGKWMDAITLQNVDLQKPETVKLAIESGAVGIGSFFAPLLHLIPQVHVRHLCSTGYLSQRIGPHVIHVQTIADSLLSPGTLRPSLRCSQDVDGGDANFKHSYNVTDDLQIWLRNLPDCPILVHVDMDYFNNRYDGDSDWIFNGAKYDPPSNEVLDRIDEVFESLSQPNLIDRTRDFAVALSPGFFPADLWSNSIERIGTHYERLRKMKTN